MSQELGSSRPRVPRVHFFRTCHEYLGQSPRRETVEQHALLEHDHPVEVACHRGELVGDEQHPCTVLRDQVRQRVSETLLGLPVDPGDPWKQAAFWKPEGTFTVAVTLFFDTGHSAPSTFQKISSWSEKEFRAPSTVYVRT